MGRPMLSRGSTGQAVKLLQAGLNAEGNSAQADLVPDGIFGPMTDARVKEFQRLSALVPDGVVGPLTYDKLEPFLVVLEGLIDFGVIRPEVEDAARQRICATAELQYSTFGWGVIDPPHSFATIGPANPRILAKVAAGPTAAPGVLWRQGGQALAAYYRLARAFNPARCVTITQQFWQQYGSPGPLNSPTSPAPRIPFDLSNNDTGAWCGIFVNAVFRMSGLKTQAWQIGGAKGGLKIEGKVFLSGTGATTADFRALGPKKAPKSGDIGIEDATNHNHHFIIVKVEGDNLSTVEGNAGHAALFNYSEIIRRGPGTPRGPRPLAAFRSQPGNFILTPIWAQLGVK